jgi:Effector-associated domain 1
VFVDPDLNRRLRVTLAGLYDKSSGARIVARDVGLDHTRINFDGASQACWQEVIDEAVKHNLVVSLVVRARSDYKADSALQALLSELNPSANSVVSTVLPARTVSLTERHALLLQLQREAPDEGSAQQCAEASGLSLPDTLLDGSRWTWLVQQLHLRNLNLAPLYTAARRALPRG